MSRSDFGILQEHNDIAVLRVKYFLLGLLSLKSFLLLLQIKWNGFLLKRAYYAPFLLVLKKL